MAKSWGTRAGCWGEARTRSSEPHELEWVWEAEGAITATWGFIPSHMQGGELIHSLRWLLDPTLNLSC